MKTMFASLVVLLLATVVSAQSPTDLITLKFSYMEPGMNVDGTALDDLDSCTVVWKMDGVSQLGVVIPASSPIGGGVMSQTVVTSFDRMMDHDVFAVANCADTVGNVSGDSAPATLHIPLIPLPDTTAPGKVSSFDVTFTVN